MKILYYLIELLNFSLADIEQEIIGIAERKMLSLNLFIKGGDGFDILELIYSIIEMFTDSLADVKTIIDYAIFILGDLEFLKK